MGVLVYELECDVSVTVRVSAIVSVLLGGRRGGRAGKLRKCLFVTG